MPPALLTALDGCKSSDIASKSTQQELNLNTMSHSDDLLQYLNESENGERVGSTTDPLHETMPDSSSDGPMNSANSQPGVFRGTRDALMTSVASSLPSDLQGLKMDRLVSPPHNAFPSSLSQGDSSNSSLFASVPNPLDGHKDVPMATAFPGSERSQGTSMMDMSHCELEGGEQSYEGNAQNYEGTVQNFESNAQNYESSAQNYESNVQSYEGTPQMQMVDFEGTPSVVTMCSSSGGVVPSLPLSGTSTQSPMGHSVPTTSLGAPRCTANAVPSEHSQSSVSSSTPESKGSMLRHLLQGEIELSSDSASPQSSHDEALNSPSSVSSPGSLYHDGSTQATLVQQSAQLEINSDTSLIIEDATPNDLWHSVLETTMMESPSKVHKAHHGADAHSSNEVSNPPVFDVGAASSPASFMFKKFGTEHGIFPFTARAQSSTNNGAKTISTSATDTRVVPVLLSEVNNSGRPVRSGMGRRLKEPSLNAHYPAKAGHFELVIKAQPEDQHRARYLTEGSRGAVKDRSGQGFPIIKLCGYSDPVTLQVFVGTETGRVKPHGFYQACRVCGKNSTPCTEREIDGTVIIEMELSPLNDMTVSIDCVGILKLRNADVEKRIGVARAKAKKKNNTRARLVFRTSLQKPDGAWQTLQIASQPILCTQPIGQPEIGRVSLKKCDVNGGENLFILGKNFMKGTEIIFQEVALESGEVTWQMEAELDTDYFQSSHLICTVPPYCNKHITSPVQVQIVASCGGKLSEPQEFTYQPLANPPPIKQEVPMETDAPVSKALPFGVSPVALELNRAVEEMQQGTSGSSGLFQLPAGMVSGIDTTPTMPSPSLTPTSLTLPQSSPAPTLPSQPSISSVPSLQMLGAGGGGGPLPQVLLVNPGSGGTPASAQVIPLGGASNSGQGPMIIVLPNNGQGVQEPQQQQPQPPPTQQQHQQQQQQQQQSQHQAQAMLQLQLHMQLQALLQQKQQRQQQQQPQPAVSSPTTASLLQQLLLSQLQGGGQMASSPQQFQPPASSPVSQTPQPAAPSQQLPPSPLAGQIPLSPLSQIPASLSMALQSSSQGPPSLPGSPSLQGAALPPSPLQPSQTAAAAAAASPHSVHSPPDNSSTLNLQGGNPMGLDTKAILHLISSSRKPAQDS